MKGSFSFLCLFLVGINTSFSQISSGNFTGNLESTFQYLLEDSVIKATQPLEKGLLNSYMNVFYTQGNFKAGMRFESYLPRIQGYPANFDGTGLGMRYVGYDNGFIDVTVGSFYEQFGAGLALRAYEDRALGYDNMLDGLKLVVRPHKGLVIKGVYGYQRYQFIEGRINHSPGIVRGFDGELNLNEAFAKENFLKTKNGKQIQVTLGGSFVSKFQKDDNSTLILPQNVGVYGGRAKLRYGKIYFDAEYMTKGQDPSQDNGYNYNPGHAAIANLGYSQKGLGVLFSAKSVDNMSYRSDRTKQLQNVLINYLPSLNKTHTYNLVSSLYPYATQPVGEIAYQFEALYTFKKNSKIGGKYGTSVNFNYSSAYRPMRHTSDINPLDSTGITYTTGMFDMSDSLYWQDFNFNISKKFNKNFNAILSYYNIILNNDVASVTKEVGLIKTNVIVLELGYKINAEQSLRAEFQTLFVNRRDSLENDVRIIDFGNKNSINYGDARPVDKGDWATLLVEYTINSSWFVALMDQYNFGNPDKKYRAHHPYATVGYVREATRVTASFGRQRAGLFCVGGVCRPVPASYGLTLSVTHSF